MKIHFLLKLSVTIMLGLSVLSFMPLAQAQLQAFTLLEQGVVRSYWIDSRWRASLDKGSLQLFPAELAAPGSAPVYRTQNRDDAPLLIPSGKIFVEFASAQAVSEFQQWLKQTPFSMKPFLTDLMYVVTVTDINEVMRSAQLFRQRTEVKEVSIDWYRKRASKSLLH